MNRQSLSHAGPGQSSYAQEDGKNSGASVSSSLGIAFAWSRRPVHVVCTYMYTNYCTSHSYMLCAEALDPLVSVLGQSNERVESESS